jgi:hypothetical protein
MGKLRVRSHWAYFTTGDDHEEYLFAKVTNRSRRRVQLTHVWVDTRRGQIFAMNRVLPVWLEPNEMFETWVAVPHGGDRRKPLRRTYALLSTGHKVRSRPNKRVPALGYVAGAGQSR